VSDPLGLLHRPDRYPRSTRYPSQWVMKLDMGPHPLRQLEELASRMDIQANDRVLDLGSGRGATSVFLAREFGSIVTAVDLTVPVEDVTAIFREAGVADRVTALQADARALPFGEEEFDAIVSIDAFEYFGTDVPTLPRLMRVLRSGGQVGMTTPALRHDPYDHPVPVHVARVVGWEAAAWHAPAWWRRHWELSGMVEEIEARWQADGREDWLRWARACAQFRNTGTDPVLDMLEADEDEDIGFTLVTARKR
jgi:cyclopropane fatty-acyl-phospholipid synthase-like methyltransferase